MMLRYEFGYRHGYRDQGYSAPLVPPLGIPCTFGNLGHAYGYIYLVLNVEFHLFIF